ncbi:MAG: LysR family transcriptional regulator [Spongiibacteraceae bacterium]
MKLSQVDLNLFVVFDTVFTEQNLTRAAEILHITQPAVSNALNRLRDTVGDPLFVRTAKGMRPTPVAQNLIEPVRAALRQFESCLQSRDQFDPATASRVFRINAGDIAEPMFVPALAHYFEQHCPGLKLEVLFVDRADAPLEMAAGNLDIAIDATLLSHPELNSIPLLRDNYVCALRRDHPLAQTALTLEHYLALRHIHISSRVRGPGHVDLALRALGQRRNIAVRLQHYVAAQAVIAATDYALSAPRRLVAEWDVAALPLPFATQPQELNVFWHKSAEHDPANEWLRQTLQAVTGFGATAAR